MSNKPSSAIRRNSESLWIESESIRLLMQSRRGTSGIAALSMLLMAVQLYGYISDGWVASWLVVSISTLLARQNLKARFAKRFEHASLTAKSAFVDRSGLFWSDSALTWGLSGWLFFANIPIQNQYICFSILNVTGFVAVLNLTPHRKTARQFINILIGTQVVGALWHIGVRQEFQAAQIQYVHLVGLVVSWVLLRVLDNRFYEAFHKNLVLQYRNTNLIQSLSRKTEQLEVEKNVVMNANETIKRFYSSAAHDIRQPVYALNVYADLITDDPTQTVKLLPKIKASCNAINALFHSLFDFEKIHSGQINVSLQVVDLAHVFDDVQKHYQALAAAKNIELRVIPATGFLETDPALLKGILYHLVSNAIKYTNHGGVLVVMRKTAQSLSFEVWDTGIGIDPLQQPHVFNEFFKVKEQSSADEGFGLGLSVVKRLAAFVDGSSVSLKSRVGRGSVFKFSLPLTGYSTNATNPSNVSSPQKLQSVKPAVHNAV